MISISTGYIKILEYSDRGQIKILIRCGLKLFSEESSIFNDTAVDGATEKVVGDVDLAVESYGKTGKIPASVMEASIFRKPYFVGRYVKLMCERLQVCGTGVK